MNKPTTIVTAFALALLVAPPVAQAQQAEKVYRIGFLTSGSVDAFKGRLAAFRQGLQELGYVEGKNIVIEERYANGRRQRLPALAMQLVRLKPDIFLTHGGSASRAADKAGREVGRAIPVVFGQQADPVGGRLVASLARPGGNITGLSDAHSLLVPKRLELLKEVLPSASRIAVIHGQKRKQLKALKAVAPRLGVTLIPVLIINPDDFDRAFAEIRRERPDAVNVLGYQKGRGFRRRFVAFARKNRLPTIHTNPRHVAAGGLMSYGANTSDMYRRAATFVDKILKGAKPAELPVEQPTKFYLTLNLKTAKALGITFPPSILLRADEVIE
jgi:putative ABC transport system substrate-binding protein